MRRDDGVVLQTITAELPMHQYFFATVVADTADVFLMLKLQLHVMLGTCLHRPRLRG